MRRSRAIFAALAFGYAFLYVPIALLIVYSFNASRLVTVWAGLSPRWYGELFHNAQILDAAWLSLRIAAATATLATILGTLAALALARAGRFVGRSALVGLLAGPLVMPEVILGLALLLLFVALESVLGGPSRGAGTIVVAHVTFSMAYVAVIVRAKLADFDRSLEEAAADLGAPPATVFLRITMPLIAPALAAGWLLAFTLSLDDLVVASFVSGPGASTLPMVVYSSVRLGVSPQINALATLLVAAVAVLVGGAGWLLGRRKRAGG
jgi:putrescine transport system permease protein